MVDNLIHHAYGWSILERDQKRKVFAMLAILIYLHRECLTTGSEYQTLCAVGR